MTLPIQRTTLVFLILWGLFVFNIIHSGFNPDQGGYPRAQRMSQLAEVRVYPINMVLFGVCLVSIVTWVAYLPTRYIRRGFAQTFISLLVSVLLTMLAVVAAVASMHAGALIMSMVLPVMLMTFISYVTTLYSFTLSMFSPKTWKTPPQNHPKNEP